MSVAHPKKINEAKVLVVEDEPRLRELLTRALSGWGFATSVARSGEEAIRLTESQPVDIAILDLNLPGKDGLETLRRLRERMPNLQAIVLTGFASIESARQAVHLDVVEFLTKPCHLGELEQALDRALRRIAPTPPAVLDKPDLPPPTAGMTLDEVERQHILRALHEHDGNRTATATALGISRRTLYYKLEEYQRQGFTVE
ncbi:MAG TPA: response regulator [Tepidisphaeraceae bacterium]|jgi:DNA-binding NtrC family response regulator|nr:response regulator [Tepidisphaeraceae bacterium]